MPEHQTTESKVEKTPTSIKQNKKKFPVIVSLFSFTLLLALLGQLGWGLVKAQDAAPPSAATASQAATSLPWYVGVLFFVTVAVGGTIFKARIAAGTKKQFTAGSCCAPLMDDDRKPQVDMPSPES